jgi:hypothetical protein
LATGESQAITTLHYENKGFGTHCGLAIYIKKSILRQKKNYGNSNISPCENYDLQKHPLKETKIL